MGSTRTTPSDRDLLEPDPPSERYLDPALRDARRRFGAAVTSMATFPDDRLDEPWPWRRGESGAQDGVMIDHRPTEVARLVRLLHAAWGRFEAGIFPSPAPVSGETLGRLEHTVSSIEATVRGVLSVEAAVRT